MKNLRIFIYLGSLNLLTTLSQVYTQDKFHPVPKLDLISMTSEVRCLLLNI